MSDRNYIFSRCKIILKNLEMYIYRDINQKYHVYYIYIQMEFILDKIAIAICKRNELCKAKVIKAVCGTTR